MYQGPLSRDEEILQQRVCPRCGIEYRKLDFLRLKFTKSDCKHHICVRCFLDLFDLQVKSHLFTFLDAMTLISNALELHYTIDLKWIAHVNRLYCMNLLLQELSRDQYLKMSCWFHRCRSRELHLLTFLEGNRRGLSDFAFATISAQSATEAKMQFTCPCQSGICQLRKESPQSLLRRLLLDDQSRPHFLKPLHSACTYTTLLQSTTSAYPLLTRDVTSYSIAQCLAESIQRHGGYLDCPLRCNDHIDMNSCILLFSSQDNVDPDTLFEALQSKVQVHVTSHCLVGQDTQVRSAFHVHLPSMACGSESQTSKRLGTEGETKRKNGSKRNGKEKKGHGKEKGKEKEKKKRKRENREHDTLWQPSKTIYTSSPYQASVDQMSQYVQEAWKHITAEDNPSFGWSSIWQVLNLLRPYRIRSTRESTALWVTFHHIMSLLLHTRGLPLPLAQLTVQVMQYISRRPGLSAFNKASIDTFEKHVQEWSILPQSSRTAAFASMPLESAALPLVARLVQKAHETCKQGWGAFATPSGFIPYSTALTYPGSISLSSKHMLLWLYGEEQGANQMISFPIWNHWSQDLFRDTTSVEAIQAWATKKLVPKIQTLPIHVRQRYVAVWMEYLLFAIYGAQWESHRMKWLEWYDTLGLTLPFSSSSSSDSPRHPLLPLVSSPDDLLFSNSPPTPPPESTFAPETLSEWLQSFETAIVDGTDRSTFSDSILPPPLPLPLSPPPFYAFSSSSSPLLSKVQPSMSPSDMWLPNIVMGHDLFSQVQDI